MMTDFPSPFNTRTTGFLFFHHAGLSCATPSTQVLVGPCHHQLIGQIHCCGKLVLALQFLGLLTAEQGWSHPLWWIFWWCALAVLLWGHFPVYFHLRGRWWCKVRVFHDGKWWIQGWWEIHFGESRREVLAYRARCKHGMQVTITLHYPFPTLSPSSIPSPFQFRHFSWSSILPWLATMATCRNMSPRALKSNQALGDELLKPPHHHR